MTGESRRGVSDAIRAAARVGNIGQVVRLSRRAEGLTQQQLGDRCGLSQAAVSRLERSRHGGDITTLRVIARELGIPHHLLGLAAPPVDGTTAHVAPDIAESDSEFGHEVTAGESLNRRGALCVIAGVALSDSLAQLFTMEPHDMGRALDSQSSDESLSYYETAADRMMMVFERAGPGAVLGPALEHFSAVRRLVEKRQSVASRQRLTRAASKLGTLLGLFAYEDDWQSRKWFAIARRAAAESGEDVLMGWAAAGESLLDYYGGRARESLRTLEAAQEWVQDGVVGAVVSARAARAHAALGEERQALAALQCAHELLDGSPSQQRDLFTFHNAQLAFYSATCNGLLGRAADAEEAAAQALLLYESHPQYMDPALVRFDIAAARLTRQRPDVEGAVAAARDAIELLPPEHRTGPVRQRAKNLVGQLRRYHTEPAARDFVELVATL